VNGIVDMFVGHFWIPVERLKIVPFALPTVYEKTFLVTKRKPGTKSYLDAQADKVLAPFRRVFVYSLLPSYL